MFLTINNHSILLLTISEMPSNGVDDWMKGIGVEAKE